MRTAQHARMLERTAADLTYAWRDKIITAGLERSRAADERALKRMEQNA